MHDPATPVPAPEMSAWKRYGIAVLAMLAATLATMAASGATARAIFIFYYPAVLVTAWVAGRGAGFVATILSVLIADYLFIPPAYSLAPLESTDLLPLALFSASAAVLSMMSARVRATRRDSDARLVETTQLAAQLQDQAAELEQQAAELEQQYEEAQSLSEELAEANRLLTERSRVMLAEAEEIGRLGSWEWDVASDHVVWSDQLYRIYGCEPQEFRVNFAAFLERVHADDRAAVRARIEASYQTGSSFQFRHRIVQPDGTIRFLEARGRVERSSDGAVLRMTGTGQDITEQVAAEELIARQASEAAAHAEAERSRSRIDRLQSLLAAVVASSADSIISIDLQQNILTWNEGAELLYGYLEREVQGKSIQLVIPSDQRAAFARLVERTRRGVAVEHHESIRETRDGRRIVVSGSMSPIRVGTDVVGISLIAHDVTEEQRTEQRRTVLAEATRTLSATLDEVQATRQVLGLLIPTLGTGAALHCVDDEGRLRLVAYLAEPPSVKDDPQLPADLFAEYPLHKVIRDGNSQVFDRAPVTPPNGLRQSLRPVSCVIAPLMVRGSVLGTLTLATNVPEQRYSRADVSFLEELARRVAIAIDNARAYEAERQARRQAEAANAARFRFVTRISHDLRTPLNAIGGYAELLELGIHGPLSAAQQQAMERILRNQRHLIGLINDLLGFARIEAGHLDLHIGVVAVHEALSSLEAMTTPAVKAKSLQYDYHPPADVLHAISDPEKLQQIVLNLLSNAIKFTPSGGRVVLRAFRLDANIVIEVIDNGIGIPADKLAAVFEPFVQIDTGYAESRGGTGLGLSISRDLARAMNGDLTVRSEQGKGSTFTLRIPAVNGPASLDQQPTPFPVANP